MKIILLGPPGSGKGTIASKLKAEFGYEHFSTGEILREERAKKTALGLEAEKYMNAGQLVPDELVIKIIKNVTRKNHNYILDGFPRTVAQAEAISDLKIDKVISLEVPEKVLIKRISGRRTCEKCAAAYHQQYVPAKKTGICDKCGGKLIQRTDEKLETVKERFKVYLEKTAPLIAYYSKKKLLQKIDASLTPAEVYEAVKKILKN